ncbi:MAG: SNF2-related protein [Waddliaceae bacterium]
MLESGERMLNFRKLKKNFSPLDLSEGKALFEKGAIQSAKVKKVDEGSVLLSAQVQGNFDQVYSSDIEIDRRESEIVDSVCNCTQEFDCHHLASVIFYLEKYFDKLVVEFSQDATIEESEVIQAVEQAKINEDARKGERDEKQLLGDYIDAQEILGSCPFFFPEEKISEDKAEIAIILTPPNPKSESINAITFHLALRLPYRSKVLNIPDVQEFLEALRYDETIYIGSRRFYFTLSSFDLVSVQMLRVVLDSVHFSKHQNEIAETDKAGSLHLEDFGSLLSKAYDLATAKSQPRAAYKEGEESEALPCLYWNAIENPLTFSRSPTALCFTLDAIISSQSRLFLTPSFVVDGKKDVPIEKLLLLECARPGIIHENIYYRFPSNIKRKHLRHLESIRNLSIPEPLFGTFVENSLPELIRFAEVKNSKILDQFVTLPYTKKLKAVCEITYLEGELDSTVSFLYGKTVVPAAPSKISGDEILSFITEDGVVARNLTEEKQLLDHMFQDFSYNPKLGVYTTKSDKRIVEFMTEIIPKYQDQVNFKCPENLKNQFLYDDTSFILKLKDTELVNEYELELTVKGPLKGTSVNTLWDCLATKKQFIELSKQEARGPGRRKKNAPLPKILVLDLDRLAPVIQVFDEIGITELDDHTQRRPLWSLTSIHEEDFEKLPIQLSMTKKLKSLQQQLLGSFSFEPEAVPATIQAQVREYQVEGVQWIERLRRMHLNGILADDMGLGKSLQTIIALTQNKKNNKAALSLIVCPTTLVYNWKEEFSKFHPEFKVLVIDGNPTQRQKLIKQLPKYDVGITSYSLLQKDISKYEKIQLSYVVLDEAQHIKNRATRNAKSVKQLNSLHKLILTGTPIENSLDELWSLFDFLMPGLLSTYDRFVDKYVRASNEGGTQVMEALRKKLNPFILRRMKRDVLKELPPVTEIVYHCHLTDVQRELYSSFAESARQELTSLVKKEGFEKIQIHVLATLTRLKQICCHPAIFAKDTVEEGDSAKYEMLTELLDNLLRGGHKAVIFSQYTSMLKIMRKDFESRGIPIAYLDGSTKNRLEVVKKFNEDKAIPIFLVSLKAGGSGLNLVGADTVIHYDMWWNPAIEFQATDRVHRIGQKNPVSCYKFVTMGTIEEKIIELQNRKKHLVKEVIASDDDAISKLTWEEVLELLKT